MPVSNKIQQTKKALLEALHKSLGVVSSACKIVGIDRTTFYRYYNEDEEFRAAVDDVGEYTIDFVETALFKQIQEGNTASTIFFLKTRGKGRGYIERQEFDHTTAGEKLTGLEIRIINATEPVTREDDIDEDI